MSKLVEVTKDFLSLVAKENIPAGSFLAHVWGPMVSQATPYTIQVDVNKHVVPVGPLKRTNQSCNPILIGLLARVQKLQFKVFMSGWLSRQSFDKYLLFSVNSKREYHCA